MATAKVKVRALNKGALESDIVVIPNGDSRLDRFQFYISPMGTPDDAVVETEIAGDREADFKAAILAKKGVTIENNPAWADVNTDDGTEGDGTAGDGVNDGTRYNWAKQSTLYEIV